MKRIIAILLVFAMILPMGIFANAADSKAEIRPFMLSNSEDLGTDYNNFYPKIMFWSRVGEDYVSEDELKVAAVNVGGETPTEVAENLKEVFDKYPDGMRYLRFISLTAAMIVLAEDIMFVDKGTQLAKSWFDEFIEHYHKIGGKIDGVIADVEYLDGSSYYLGVAAQKDILTYDKIVKNPIYKAKIRPQLEERGFKFWKNVTPETPEIYSISPNSGAEYAQSRAIWDTVNRNYLNASVTEALGSFLKYYPDGVLSDYQCRDTFAWQKIMSDTGSVAAGGNYYTAGNTNYFNSYAARPGSGFFKESGTLVYKNIPSYNGVVWEDNPFNMVLWDTIFAKNLYKSVPKNGHFTATIAPYNYSSRETCYCNTPYYSEMTYHLGLLDPEPFQSYFIKSEIVASGADVDTSVEVVSKQLEELTRIVGAADREPLDLPYTWNDSFILSGMYAGGKNYYRITPDITGGQKKEDFKVADAADPTFTAKGQTITFPGGKIIEDAVIPEVKSCGYWIETAKDVFPVVTYSENRYEEYPAFLENYESFKAGADFDFNVANPSGCYEVKKTKDATAKIVAVDGNNALAFTGDYSLKLKTILKNITAGDTYAENQAWEVEVTVPANMAAEAEIIALNIFGTKSKAEEGGFKIAGGKVYYDKAGEYVELEGVDVSAGGKFKLKRSVDFNNAEALTSDYAIYDASGELLGQVKDVPMVQVKLPVQKLNLSVAGVTGDAVLFDNFKLYANGVGADFELYNAKTGIEYTDLETAKDSNTAYRLSWMNATKYEKVYSIIAEYSDGTSKVIEEIKMAPGTDYVSMGIVEVKDGQTVKVYARNDSQPESENGGNKPSDKPGATEEKNNETVLLIIILVVAVVLVGVAITIALLLSKKKKSKKKSKKTVKKAPKKEIEGESAE